MNGRPDITCFLAVYWVWRRSGLLLQTHAHSSNEFGYAAHLVLCDKERKGLIGLAIGYWFGLATKGLSWMWLVRSQLMYFTNCCIGCLNRANWRCLTSTRLVCTTVHQELTNLESRVHIRMRSGRTGYVQKWVMYLNPQFFPIRNIRRHKRLYIYSSYNGKYLYFQCGVHNFKRRDFCFKCNISKDGVYSCFNLKLVYNAMPNQPIEMTNVLWGLCKCMKFILLESERAKDGDGFDQVGNNPCNSTSSL